MERTLISSRGIEAVFLPMAPPTSLRGTLLLLATVRLLPMLRRLRPRVTVATGGYVSAPASLASWLMRIPVVLFLPDIKPGKAVAWLAPLARVIAVSAEDTVNHLPGRNVVVTGYPVRHEFFQASPESGRARFDVKPGETVVCVFGGSQGSRSINNALAAFLPSLLEQCVVLHVCGQQRVAEVEAATGRLDAVQRSRYHLYPFLDAAAMADALAVADLVVCRSGASVLGELPVLGTPAILVPFPDAAVHQQENADFLERHGAALVVDDDRVHLDLGSLIISLLSDRDRLAGMARRCASLARPDATQRLGDLILEYAS